MAKATKYPTVPTENLRWTLDPADLPFETTADLDPLTEIVGQKRGVEAIRFGLGMEKKGYNILVTGESRSGRLSTIRRLLGELSETDETPDDLCYVNNFKTEDEPTLLRFPAGDGIRFKKSMQQAVDSIKDEIPALFESQEYMTRKKEVMEAHEKRTREFFKDLDKKVKDAGFAMVNVQVGQMQRPEVVPMVDGEPVHILNLEERVEKGRFPKEEFEELQAKYKELKEEIDSIFLEIRDLQKEIKKKSEEVDKQLFLSSARDLMQPVFNGYQDEKVQKYLEAALQDMGDNLDSFRTLGKAPKEGPMPGMMMQGPTEESVMHPYQVNLLVDNSETTGRPVIVESYPTYRNLFGSIERVWDRNGMWRTDYTNINAGSFVKANGGFLVINLMDAIMEPGVWQTLKRALKTAEIEIQTFDPYYYFTATGMKPESVEMDVKVLVLADTYLYHMLRFYDPDVPKIFKVRADFEDSMEKSDEAVELLSRFIKTVGDMNEFRPFDRNAVALLVEHAVRMAGRQEKVSTAFPKLKDLLSEADYFAAQDGQDVIKREHLEQAIEGRRYRSNRIEESLQEMIDRGSFFIDTDGDAVGQLNGLAVYSMGDYMFGKPSRITAVTSLGKEGIINIEREADLSGPTHNKGMLILSGYLRDKFAQDMPLTLTASIAFEQSYGGIDGDSASSTELYALLSSLSEIPIKQGVAVTGSVNQRGEVQPIGGVNEKIEGFFLCCKNAGLTGEQGCMIPAANVKDLMLRQEVVDAVKQGKFNVWAVKTIDEGIELLTGVKAGKRGKNGKYTKGSVYAGVEQKLKDYAERLRKFAEGDDDKKKKKSAKKKTEKKEDDS